MIIKMKKILSIYQEKFAFILPMIFLVLTTIFIDDIPYLNLVKHFSSTVILSICFVIFLRLIENNSRHRIKILGGLLITSYILHLFQFLFHSEIIGNLFYIYLSYCVMVEIVQTKNKINEN